MNLREFIRQLQALQRMYGDLEIRLNKHFVEEIKPPRVIDVVQHPDDGLTSDLYVSCERLDDSRPIFVEPYQMKAKQSPRKPMVIIDAEGW